MVQDIDFIIFVIIVSLCLLLYLVMIGLKLHLSYVIGHV